MHYVIVVVVKNINIVVDKYNMNTFCGFIAIIGKPNVGKSKLINHIVGKKISITSDRTQTTRYAITGIRTIQDNTAAYQFVFVDTPGLEKKITNKYSSVLNKSVLKTLEDVDIILWVIEAHKFTTEDENVLNIVKNITKKPVFLIVNKIDKAKTFEQKQHMQSIIMQIKPHCQFLDIALISAKHSLGINELLATIKQYLPSSPLLFDINQQSTRESNFIIQETIREKTFRYLGQELPYTLIIELEHVADNVDLLTVKATIFVTKESHKAIVIGHKGAMLKKISMESRLDLEQQFHKKVFLEVWVKYRPNKQINLNFE
jgi:GTP-binding protein Era